jgi:hypothetical protein
MPNQNASIDRRALLQQLGLGLLGSSCVGWLPGLAAELATDQRRHLILLWMNGGPSQIDTFDMKPGHANGGAFKEQATRVPGLRFSEHLPLLAQHADQLAIVRSLSSKEGDHARGTHLARTGHAPVGDVAYPSIACSLGKELAQQESLLPSYVSVAPNTSTSPAAFGPGFLGQRYAPALVAAQPVDMAAAGGDPATAMRSLKVEHLHHPPGVDPQQAQRRLQFWQALEHRFLKDRQTDALRAHHELYLKASELMTPEVRTAFDLSQESLPVRQRYGPGLFGQGCLLARRLVERGVSVVEVSLGDGLAWDTHQDNFRQVKTLSQQLDAGWATLMSELQERGLLASTTILWMGEFGRTPIINSNGGRDHFPNAWSCVLGGGGIAGGQAYGRTSADGTQVEENPVAVADVLSTLCQAVGVSPQKENVTSANRPLALAEGTPIADLLS